MEAARTAAVRGHDVTLLEKEARLGGQFNLAPIPPGKQELGKWIRYLATQVKKSGAEIRLNTEATAELVSELDPDVVVVATGGRPLVPDLPGASGGAVITASDVFAGALEIKRGKVLVIGGGMMGCEVADMLADTVGVTIVESLDDVGKDVLPQSKMLLLPRLEKKGVRLITSAPVKEILEDGVVVEREGREERIVGMDFVVLACGAERVDELSVKLEGRVDEIHVIGDAKEPRKMLSAVLEGFEVGRKI
jgi:NADPH-dependent 2,4-dienoyl-CoA reductase/sulfur reductase-like enzyme